MMLLALALLQAAAVPAASLDAIGAQQLPAKGCAAFLWTLGEDHQLVAMATAEPGGLRVSLAGKRLDLVRTSAHGDTMLGLSATTAFVGDGITATLDMSFAPRGELTKGARVPEATLRIERDGQDTLITPVAGLIGCA